MIGEDAAKKLDAPVDPPEKKASPADAKKEDWIPPELAGPGGAFAQVAEPFHDSKSAAFDFGDDDVLSQTSLSGVTNVKFPGDESFLQTVPQALM